MIAPSLLPATQTFALPTQPRHCTSFAVRRDGQFGERAFRSGEHLVLDGCPSEGDMVVLVANGRGRPRLGRVQGNQLVGDRGEPCSRSRWSIAGRVAGVARQLANGWVVESLSNTEVVSMMTEPVVSLASQPQAEAATVPQLSLFVA